MNIAELQEMVLERLSQEIRLTKDKSDKFTLGVARDDIARYFSVYKRDTAPVADKPARREDNGDITFA